MFIPSKHGFKFENSFKSWPLLVLWKTNNKEFGFGDTDAMCGGMSFAALDYYHNKKLIPQDNFAPDRGEKLFNYIRKRQLDCANFPFGMLKTYYWTAWCGSLLQSSEREFKNLFFPSPLILIKEKSLNPFRANHNHVVVAFASKDDIISIYDPNYPLDDKITITISENKIEHSHIGEIRGFYIPKYKKGIPT